MIAAVKFPVLPAALALIRPVTHQLKLFKSLHEPSVSASPWQDTKYMVSLFDFSTGLSAVFVDWFVNLIDIAPDHVIGCEWWKYG